MGVSVLVTTSFPVHCLLAHNIKICIWLLEFQVFSLFVCFQSVKLRSSRSGTVYLDVTVTESIEIPVCLVGNSVVYCNCTKLYFVKVPRLHAQRNSFVVHMTN